MGSHCIVDCRRRSIVMKLLLLSLVCVAVHGQGHEEMKQIMDTLNLYNLRINCWGESNTNNYQVAIMKAQEKCMHLAPSFDLIKQLVPQSNPFNTLPAQVYAPFRKLQDFQNLDELKSLWRTKRQATPVFLSRIKRISQNSLKTLVTSREELPQRCPILPVSSLK